MWAALSTKMFHPSSFYTSQNISVFPHFGKLEDFTFLMIALQSRVFNHLSLSVDNNIAQNLVFVFHACEMLLQMEG